MDDEPRQRDPLPWRPMLLAGLTATGCALGSLVETSPGPWWALAVAALLTAAMLARRRAGGPVGSVALAVAFMALVASWAAWRSGASLPADHLAHFATDEPRLARLRGVVVSPPSPRFRAGGAMGRFAFYEPRTYQRLEVEGLWDGRAFRPARGEVMLRLPGDDRRFAVGDRIEITGLFSGVAPPMNPGEFDRVRYGRARGWAGTLATAAPGNARRLGRAEGIRWTLARRQDSLRRRAAGWLLDRLDENSESAALLEALLLGERGPELADVEESFRRTGLAHVLSISGLHLAILVIAATLSLKAAGAPSWLRHPAIALFIIAYLAIVPAQAPIRRAGVMGLCYVAAEASGRRLHPLAVLAWSLLIVLLLQPDEILSPGCQFSFGMVGALLVMTRPVRRRWFGDPPDPDLLSPRQHALEWFRNALVVCLVAWLIGLPLTAHHFGSIPLYGAIVSLFVVPVVSVILVVGLTKALLAIALPIVAAWIAAPLDAALNLLIDFVAWADALPGAAILVVPPGIVWTIASTALIAWSLLRPLSRPLALARLVSIAALLAIAFIPPAAWPWSPMRHRVSITMFAVGDGSCYLVRSGSEAILFDAGSGSFPGAGRAVVVPAIQRMGVSRVPTIVLSHADYDHFCFVPDLLGPLGVNRLIVTDAMLQQARDSPHGALAWMLNFARRRGCAIETASAGCAMTLGPATLRWLAPDPAADFPADNDRSAVLRLDAFGRRVLFTGDVQEAAIARLLTLPRQTIRADVMELPHHGGWSDAAVAFVDAVNPAIVLQSAGRTRLRGDRWPDALTGRARYVSARDGSTSVTIRAGGDMEVTATRSPTAPARRADRK